MLLNRQIARRRAFTPSTPFSISNTCTVISLSYTILTSTSTACASRRPVSRGTTARHVLLCITLQSPCPAQLQRSSAFSKGCRNYKSNADNPAALIVCDMGTFVRSVIVALDWGAMMTNIHAGSRYTDASRSTDEHHLFERDKSTVRDQDSRIGSQATMR